MQDNTETARPRWLSDALLIAALPALSYFFTLTFEFAYAGEFRIPYQFVTVTWTDVFVDGFLLLLVVFALFLLSLFLSSLTRRGRLLPGYLRALNSTPKLLMILASISLFWVEWHQIPLFIVIIGFILGFVTSVIMHRDQELHATSDPRKARQRQTALLALLWIVAGIVSSMTLGILFARTRKEYYVTETTPQAVVLGIWSDILVAAPFDPKTRTVRTEFIITRLSESAPLHLKLERLGPLHIERPDRQITK